MKTLNLYKAQPVGANTPEPLRIVIAATLPDFDGAPEGWEKRTQQCFDSQAAALDEALYQSLPGGTYDRLLAVMLQRKASLYIVSRETVESRK